MHVPYAFTESGKEVQPEPTRIGPHGRSVLKENGKAVHPVSLYCAATTDAGTHTFYAFMHGKGTSRFGAGFRVLPITNDLVVTLPKKQPVRRSYNSQARQIHPSDDDSKNNDLKRQRDNRRVTTTTTFKTDHTEWAGAIAKIVLAVGANKVKDHIDEKAKKSDSLFFDFLLRVGEQFFRNGRDMLIASTVRDVFPSMRKEGAHVVATVIGLYIDDQFTFENASEEVKKDLVVRELKKRYPRMKKALTVANFTYDVFNALEQNDEI